MKPSTARELQAEARRNQLLDLALALFAERGVEHVSIKDLATEAGVAQGLPYHYFRSKDELLVAVFQRHNPLPQLRQVLAEIDGLPAREGLVVFARRLSALWPEKRLILRLVLRELLSPRSTLLSQALPAREEVVIELSAYLQRRIEAGELRPHQPSIAVHLLVSSLLTLALLEQPAEPMISQMVEMLFEGIQAR
ncbi:MAG: TetR/AcrR family transcriptional regulator [Ktedonobacteraceae bacterium]|nr:TetR/AcrR family transcriptional regulator [Ktedonobacteraceae bacterium]